MAISHVETFAYNDWSISVDRGDDVYSSGQAEKYSELYPINKVLGNITASVTGGFGWISAYDEDYEEVSDSLYCNLEVSVYFVTGTGDRVKAIPSATGSATRGGYLHEYNASTTQTLTFDTSTITAEQKALYESLQIGYRCTTSSSHVSISRVGDFQNGAGASPTGTASITVRDTINVEYDSIELTDLYLDGTEMSGLSYDGTIIY